MSTTSEGTSIDAPGGGDNSSCSSDVVDGAVPDASTTTTSDVRVENSPCDDGTSGNQLDNTWSNTAPENNVNTNVCTNPYDLLEPMERFEKYATSDIIFHRQVATRSILETLHEVRHNEADVSRIVDMIAQFSVDAEPSVRVELMEQLPHIAAYFVNQINPMSPLFFNTALPLFKQFLSDSGAQVRKVTQNSLTIMLEQGFISREFLEQKIHSVLIQSLSINLDDYRIEALTTVSKIIRFLGKESTERLFLAHFTRLCSDGSYNVRRVCASNFGEFSTVVGQEVTEEVLLPHFKLLCEDVVWGVRRSCADVFVPVSCVCSNDARRNILAPLFVKLLCDPSRWVTTPAFQALGPFISTFADPSKTGLYYNDGGVVAVDDMKDHDNDSGCSEDSEEGSLSPETEDCEVKDISNSIGTLSISDEHLELGGFTSTNCTAVYNGNAQDGKRLTLRTDNESAFNNFQYWRVPIPDIDIDVEATLRRKRLVQNVSAQNSLRRRRWELSVEDQKELESGDSVNDFQSPVVCSGFSNSKNGSECGTQLTTVRLGFNNNKIESERRPLKQNIIPQDLLGHYLSMINPLNFQMPDLSHHCAYSLPAVALTLGRKYWPCLKETYEILASDMQWKVRWTLASSLHQMSLILGPEYTSRDLLPVFLSFMKDLDEVRFGILQNLSSILELLNRTEQLGILPKISEFLKMDNYRNWRFRSTLADQLISIARLYNASEVKQYLIPIALTLIHDKISEVRLSAIRVFSTLIKRVFCDRDASDKPNELQLSLMCELKSRLQGSPKWVLRQAFVLLCERIVMETSMPLQDFKNELLEPLLHLSTDPVANVRLVLARSLANTICRNEYLWSLEAVQLTVNRLHHDKDQDVRKYLEPIVVKSKLIETAQRQNGIVQA